MLTVAKRRCRLRLSRWRFDRLPPQRRVRLDLHTDGRQLSFLLASIHGAGYGLQLAGGPMLFRELLSFSRYSSIAARVDNADLDCSIALWDQLDHSSSASRSLAVDYDVFTQGRPGIRMPYTMHPSIYYNNAHLSPALPELCQKRIIRVGFYGTHDPDFYTKHYFFPGLTRAELLASFIDTYGPCLAEAPCSRPQAFAVSIDDRGGENRGPKKFLSQNAYLSMMRQTVFALCLPGWCMPLSHSLIEALYCGAIPITNAHRFMHPPLRNGVEALTFETISEFHDAILLAQSMSESDIAAMRSAAIQYYLNYLEPIAWWNRLLSSSSSTLLVNAEELSVPLMTHV